MRMSQELKIADFSFDSSSHISGDQLLAVDDLQGDLLPANVVYSELNFAKRTFS
jgi:hypothetical protein